LKTSAVKKIKAKTLLKLKHSTAKPNSSKMLTQNFSQEILLEQIDCMPQNAQLSQKLRANHE